MYMDKFRSVLLGYAPLLERLVSPINSQLNNPKMRKPFSILFAVLISFLLFWMMSFLVSTGNDGLDDSERIKITDFINTERNKDLLDDLSLLKPSDIKPPPPKLDQDFDDQNINNDSSIKVSSGISDFNFKIGSGISSGEGEYIPIVKVAPIYPQGALQRGIEGYCVVEYDVTEIGTVANPVVLDGECSSSLFKRASVRAAAKFKYKPRVVDGVAVKVVGVRNRFTYAIEK